MALYTLFLMYIANFEHKNNDLSPDAGDSCLLRSGKRAYFALWFVLRALSILVSIFMGEQLRTLLRGLISIVEGICAFRVGADAIRTGNIPEAVSVGDGFWCKIVFQGKQVLDGLRMGLDASFLGVV